jgi:hypothetical protein
MAERKITDAELNFLWPVFYGRLPVQKINIKDDFGLNDRAWCEPGILGNWILHMGPEGYKNCTSSSPIKKGGDPIRYVFVHECVHVWQGWNGTNYVLNSLWSQCTGGAGVYSYEVGKSWSSYNVEQQAAIVADWWARGRSTTDSRYRYLRDHIWKGRTH